MQRAPVFLLFAPLVAIALPASAKPPGPLVLCATYPDAPACAAGAYPACVFCHTVPPARNPYGKALEQVLAPSLPRPLTDEQFTTALPAALMALEAEDADGDGASNLDETLFGSYPGDPQSVPIQEATCPTSRADNGWDVCGYDPVYVYQKLSLDFCGRAPSYDQIQAFEILEDKSGALDEKLSVCLDSEHWVGKDGVVWRLAHRKIKPTQSIKSGEDAGAIPIGNYEDDYNLFVYTQIDDHDARDVLLAKYWVRRSSGGPTTYEKYEATPLQELNQRGACEAQLIAADRRAGLLTTRWNLLFNTMFTPMPRTTAAQAYRAYLGLDIAKMQGLEPVAGEPVDYDQKGVTDERCAVCHSTLDPLSYPFTRYAGFNGGSLGIPFTYNQNRMSALADGDSLLASTPESGVIFGTEVADLEEWAAVAANSTAFRDATVLDYWKLLLGEMPRPAEQGEFSELSRKLSSHYNYSVEKMLHDLIRTEAYGVP